MAIHLTRPSPEAATYRGSAARATAQLVAELAEVRAHNAALTRQLADSRTIGMAIGIIADKLKLRTDRAEEILHAVSAELGADVAATARHLVRTGRLP